MDRASENYADLEPYPQYAPPCVSLEFPLR